MPPQLVVVSGPDRERLIPLEEGRTFTFGRLTQSDISVHDLFVSRRHGQIAVEGGRVLIRDLGSLNGTWVNGQRLGGPGQPHDLRPGDQVRIGDTRFRLQQGPLESEPEWLACTDPAVMLNALRGRASVRKLRLFACACYRDVWHLLGDARSRDLVSVSERYADGLASAEEWETVEQRFEPWPERWPAPVWPVVLADALTAATRSASATARVAGEVSGAEGHRYGLCRLLRDIFNPFRTVRVDPAWLRGNGGSAARVAQAIYAGRTFEDLPVLADALEDGGCTDEPLLSHCRTPGGHALGCWALDALLGKA